MAKFEVKEGSPLCTLIKPFDTLKKYFELSPKCDGIQGEIWIWWAQNIIKRKETEGASSSRASCGRGSLGQHPSWSRGSRAHFLCEEVYPEICSLCSDISPYCFEFRHLFYLLEHFWGPFLDLSAQFSWSSLWELTWMTSKASFRSLYDLSR